MTKPAEATLGDISLNRLAVCECSDFNVCFVLEPFGVSDGPLSLHVERACFKTAFISFNVRAVFPRSAGDAGTGILHRWGRSRRGGWLLLGRPVSVTTAEKDDLRQHLLLFRLRPLPAQSISQQENVHSYTECESVEGRDCFFIADDMRQ